MAGRGKVLLAVGAAALLLGIHAHRCPSRLNLSGIFNVVWNPRSAMTSPLGTKSLRNVRPVPKIGKLLWVHFL